MEEYSDDPSGPALSQTEMTVNGCEEQQKADERREHTQDVSALSLLRLSSHRTLITA